MQSRQSPNSEKDSILPWAVKSSFNRFTNVSLKIHHVESHISFDKNWFERKSAINSFWIWTQVERIEKSVQDRSISWTPINI
jgi:hypothetical protein